MDNPPEVLLAKAREINQKLGYATAPVSSSYGFDYRFGSIRIMRLSETQGSRLTASRPAAVTFVYRSSPVPLVPRRVSDIPRVSRTDPPEDVPGMLEISTDMQGRMRGFIAVPPQFDAAKGPWPEPDWTAFFAAAGLDLGRFKAVEPEWTPAVMADARMAWLGNYPETPEIPIRVEAAEYHGRPVSYTEILSPQQTPLPAPAGGGNDRSPGALVYLALELIVMIGSVPFARYNLRLGRGDTRGAVRLGLFALCLGLGSWLIGGTHAAGAGEADLFVMAAMRSVFGAVTLALTYVSFEPFVRRSWPQTMISWSRVLAGGFRDPLVGRDILIGCLGGVVLVLIQSFGNLLYGIRGTAALKVSTDLVTLSGGRFLAGEFLLLIADTLNKALGILFLIFLFRVLLRKQWLAAGLVIVMLAAMYATNDPNPLIGWPVNIVFFGLMVFILMQFGLLAVAVALFVAIFVNQFPVNTDWSVWYAGEAAFTVLFTVALALFGFRTALAGQPLFKTG
jgi:serine/threonine-protein kinase